MSPLQANPDRPTTRVVDLNADLAEGYGRWSFGTDDDLLHVVSSANVACGFHAGDPTTIRSAVRLAAERGVAIGAHVGYPDLVGFGRRYLAMAHQELVDAVVYQIAALDGMARAAGAQVTYVKPHGALYNRTMVHDDAAAAVVQAITEVDSSLAVMGLAGLTFLTHATAAGLPTIREAFADRAYLADGTLAPRALDGAVLHDPSDIAARVVRMVSEHGVETIDGDTLMIEPDSICIHGDTPGAVDIGAAVRKALLRAGVQVASPQLAMPQT